MTSKISPTSLPIMAAAAFPLVDTTQRSAEAPSPLYPHIAQILTQPRHSDTVLSDQFQHKVAEVFTHATQKEEKKLTPPTPEAFQPVSSDEHHEGAVAQCVQYGKIGLGVFAARDSVRVAQAIVQQKTVSDACIASVGALSSASSLTTIGALGALGPSIVERIYHGNPWEQAATITAAAAACYCSGGAILPAIVFGEGAGIAAHALYETREKISSTEKKLREETLKRYKQGKAFFQHKFQQVSEQVESKKRALTALFQQQETPAQKKQKEEPALASSK